MLWPISRMGRSGYCSRSRSWSRWGWPPTASPGAAAAEIHRRAALRQGLAVAQVVVSRHQDAPVVEIPGKIVIPQDVLRHAVGDL